MRKKVITMLLVSGLAGAAWQGADGGSEVVKVDGLNAPVRLVRDPWGVTHIYAENERDLFFAQGYNAARDRLFQLELWRRTATGTMAEIVGKRALERDLGARLLSFRGNLTEELQHYHPRGQQIIGAFVDGINAYVELARKHPAGLPLEFRLLGIEPGLWTPEVVVSRHNGLFRNARDEVRLARLISKIGIPKLKELVDFQPGDPSLTEAAELDLASLPETVLQLYRASRSGFEFTPADIVDPAWRGSQKEPSQSARAAALDWLGLPAVGSNNWVVAPHRSLTGKAWMANDPHRSLQVPSLRYFVHLSAPGWNVIGGGEPALPGISIGHNGFGAWGLTIFSVDQEDLYIYRTHPEDATRYFYQGEWEEMRRRQEQFEVEGEGTVRRDQFFTRHGPVLFQDRENHRAYALRAAWLEVGSAPYLASLRFGQARSWEEFQQACAYFRTPSENMVWADLAGNIGWQATGITPVRPNWSGLLPVAGDGRYEWGGYLPPSRLPQVLNPPEGVFATANQNNLPAGYSHQIGYLWSPPHRFARIGEFLASRRLLGMSDMLELQTDVLSVPARSLVRLLAGLTSPRPSLESAIQSLQQWDFRLTADSPTAALYAAWERRLVENVWELHLPPEIKEDFTRKSLRRAVIWLTTPDARFGANPVAGRDQLLLRSLEEALAELEERFGADRRRWRYGDEKLHHVLIRHPLSDAVTKELSRRLNAGPLPRGGNRDTVNMTTSSDNQRSGGSFRVIVNLADWDRSLASNAPGQSGDPDSPHYRDLFPEWARDRYFPLIYSRSKVEEVADSVLTLTNK